MMETQHITIKLCHMTIENSTRNHQTLSQNDNTSPGNDKPHHKTKLQDQKNKDYMRKLRLSTQMHCTPAMKVKKYFK